MLLENRTRLKNKYDSESWKCFIYAPREFKKAAYWIGKSARYRICLLDGNLFPDFEVINCRQ